jgi:hypothetical protein
MSKAAVQSWDAGPQPKLMSEDDLGEKRAKAIRLGWPAFAKWLGCMDDEPAWEA